jgi:hypothetical protein
LIRKFFSGSSNYSSSVIPLKYLRHIVYDIDGLDEGRPVRKNPAGSRPKEKPRITLGETGFFKSTGGCRLPAASHLRQRSL